MPVMEGAWWWGTGVSAAVASVTAKSIVNTAMGGVIFISGLQQHPLISVGGKEREAATTEFVSLHYAEPGRLRCGDATMHGLEIVDPPTIKTVAETAGA